MVDALVADGLIFPVVILAVLGFLVPRVLGRFVPEGVRPLMLNALVSTLILFVLSAFTFFMLYLGQGVRAEILLSSGLLANLVYFGRLGLASALIWAPIMILSLAGLPRKWVKETW
ncbi:MAG: hypothetical protein AAFQ09_04005 [Pseudomonadota bacterium]